jgi:hypothetical protein
MMVAEQNRFAGAVPMQERYQYAAVIRQKCLGGTVL